MYQINDVFWTGGDVANVERLPQEETSHGLERRVFDSFLPPGAYHLGSLAVDIQGSILGG